MAIPSATKRYHHVGTTQHDIQMGIRSEDAAHILTVLSDLYSDKIMAVIREYSTNARDSHLEAGVDRPIRVTLPTQHNLEFSVEDFGVGLSVNDIEKIYANYGASSKRDNAEVTGQLGLGSKSGLTYAPQFTVTAVKNGVQVVAVVTKDEVGVGVIRILDTRHTEKPNGVKITFPVNSGDVHAFYIKATQFFRYWEAGTFEVTQGDGPVDILSIFDDPKWTHLDDDVLILPEWGDIKILMGGVVYTAPERIDGVSVLARVNMGDIDFTPSRESLHMTSQSRYCLDMLKDYVQARMADRVAEKIMSSSRWEGAREWLNWSESLRAQIKARHPNAVRRWSVQMGSGVGWSYSFSRATASKMGQSTRYGSLDSAIVVVGHPFKTLSPNIRGALENLRSELTQDGTAIRNAFVLPRGAIGTEDLEGHPHLYTYDEIKARVVKAPRAPRKKVQYEVTLVSGVTVNMDEDVVPAQNPLFTVAEKFIPDRGIIKHFGLPVVNLRSQNQVNKFMRLYPKARNFWDVTNAEAERILKALTPQERDALQIIRQGSLTHITKELDDLLVADDDLKATLRLSVDPSENMILAHLFKVNVSYNVYGWSPTPLKQLDTIGEMVGIQHSRSVARYNALYRIQGQAVITALGSFTGAIQPAPLFAW